MVSVDECIFMLSLKQDISAAMAVSVGQRLWNKDSNLFSDCTRDHVLGISDSYCVRGDDKRQFAYFGPTAQEPLVNKATGEDNEGNTTLFHSM